MPAHRGSTPVKGSLPVTLYLLIATVWYQYFAVADLHVCPHIYHLLSSKFAQSL